MKKLLIAIVALTAGVQLAQAQPFREIPLENNPVLERYIQSFPDRAAVCPPQTVTLPFFDDFSAEGPYPDCDKWQDNQVYVNRSFAINPPGIGTATFDGLNATGRPYDEFAVVNQGLSADTLTSQMINLGGIGVAYLYFEVQNKGNGDAPEERDSLMLEFLDNTGTWDRILTFKTSQFPVSDQFFNFTVPVTQSQYLYNAFQFRFRNLATISGNNDHWNLDYVSVTSNDPQGAFPDVAILANPTPLLKNYTSMPYYQFKGFSQQEINDDPRISVFNASSSTSFLDFIGMDIQETVTGTNVFSLTTGANFTSSNINSRERGEFQLNLIAPYDANFFSQLDNFSEDRIVIQNVQEISPNFNNDDVSNNILTTETILDNYYAYDDGSAETRIVAQAAGTRIAVEFTPNKDDTLRGFFVHFPYFNGAIGPSDFINIKVWKGSLSDATEALSDDFIQPQDFDYQNYTDSLNGWWSYPFSEPVGVSAGETFYVGWEQGTGDDIPFGFDRNHPEARSKTWMYVGGVWDTLSPFLQGAVMLRPVLGSEPVQMSDVKEPGTNINQVAVYPNPALDQITFDWNRDVTEGVMIVTNILGETVMNLPVARNLNIGTLPSGTYAVTLISGQQRYLARFIKQ